jgi:hypothetical protein
VHLRIIADETAYLSDADVAEADAILAGLAQSMTFGQLRYAAHRLVLKLDPGYARRRKEEARKDAHVRRFREGSGNAGMVAREMAADEVLASWQHVEQRALDLRAAGLEGTLQELRVRAYLDLLQERDTRTARTDPAQPGTPQGNPQEDSDEPSGTRAPDGTGDGHDATGDQDGPSDGNGGSGRGPRRGPAGTGPGGPDGGARQPQPSTGPSVAALVNITVPLATALGQSRTPGEAVGFGLLDAQSVRDLIAAAARSPHTRWCVTALYPDGTAAAHGCATGQHPAPPGPEPPGAGPRIRRYPVRDHHLAVPVALHRSHHQAPPIWAPPIWALPATLAAARTSARRPVPRPRTTSAASGSSSPPSPGVPAVTGTPRPAINRAASSST